MNPPLLVLLHLSSYSLAVATTAARTTSIMMMIMTTMTMSGLHEDQGASSQQRVLD